MYYPRTILICSLLSFFCPSLYSMDDASEGPARSDGSEESFVIEVSQEDTQSSSGGPGHAARIISLLAGEYPSGKCHHKAARLLENRFNGGRKGPKTIPLHQLRRRKEKAARRRELADEVDEARQLTFSLLSAKQDHELSQQPDALQLLSQLVIKEFIEERQKLKELQQNSDWWKRVNGIIATVMTVAGPRIGVLVKYLGQNTSDCSGATNSTM